MVDLFGLRATARAVELECEGARLRARLASCDETIAALRAEIGRLHTIVDEQRKFEQATRQQFVELAGARAPRQTAPTARQKPRSESQGDPFTEDDSERRQQSKRRLTRQQRQARTAELEQLELGIISQATYDARWGDDAFENAETETEEFL